MAAVAAVAVPADGLSPLHDVPHDRLLDDQDDSAAAYAEDATRVREVVEDYDHHVNHSASRHEPHAEEVAVPTEYLQDDLDTLIELPANFRAGKAARFIAAQPRRVLNAIAVASAVMTLWVALSAGEKFSAKEELFRAESDPAVTLYFGLNGDHLREKSALGSALPAAGRRLQSTGVTDLELADSRVGVTLVYEKRGSGSVLGLRELKAVHDIEGELAEWAQADGRCWTGSGTPLVSDTCLPADSLVSFLYPSVHDATLTFDGALAADRYTCELPPFGEDDVGELARWLRAREQGGFFEYVAEGFDEDSAITTGSGGVANATLKYVDPATAAAAAAASPPPPPPPGAHYSSRWLRSTLFFAPGGMSSADWYELASKLYDRSASWFGTSEYVRLYYGGPTELLTAQLLVALAADLWLLLAALLFTLVYFRVFFGQWRLAALAGLQLFLALPIMYFFVCVPFGQSPLSAFATASLWVVVGVSADNIFVLSETWGQSSRLLRDGRRASTAERLAWSVQQAGVPLFFANATTAVSLIINCASPIPAIFQFGLCGGTLLFVNMGLALTWLPALLILQDDGAFDVKHDAAARREGALFDRMRRMQALHRGLFGGRRRVLGLFGVAVLLLAPAALTITPGADSTFTFSPDPTMLRVIELAKHAPPPASDGIFLSAEGAHTTDYGRTSLTVAESVHHADGAGAVATPSRYVAMLAGSYAPPTPPKEATGYAVVLSILWLLDAPLLAALAHVLVNDRPLSFLQPPEATPPRLVAAALLPAACLLLVLAVTTLCLAVWLCNFAVAYYYPIGELLWMCLAAHSFLLYKLSRVWLHDTPWGVLRPTEWTMRRSPEPAHGATMASVFCGVGAAVVFLAVNAGVGGPGGGWLPDFSLGFAFWGPRGLDPSGLTFLLALALLYDGLVLAKLARVSYHHFNTGEHVDSLLRPCVAQRGLAAGGAAALLLLAFTVLVLSGIPLSRAFSPSPLGNLLGTVCLVNALGHAAAGHVVRSQTPLGFLQPTSYARSHREVSMWKQAVWFVLWLGAAVLAYAAANNPTPCDTNHDDAISLGEVVTCTFVDELGGWIAVHAPPLSEVALGLLLSLLWVFDGLAAMLACRVLRFELPILCLRPLEPRGDADGRPGGDGARVQDGRYGDDDEVDEIADGRDPRDRGRGQPGGGGPPPRIGSLPPRTRTLYRRLRAASVAAIVSGVLVAMVSASPTAFYVVLGPNGIAASNLLALSLLAHVYPLLRLTNVLRTNVPSHMLAPTDWSRASPRPFVLTAAAALFCLATGVLIVVTQDSLPSLSGLPGLGGLSLHGLLLFAMLFCDAWLLLSAAAVQFSQQREHLLRPMPGLSLDELYDLGDAIANAGGALCALAWLSLWLAIWPSAASALFGGPRVLSVAMELCLSLHGLLLGCAAYLLHLGEALAVFEAPPGLDEELQLRYMRLLGGGGLSCLFLAIFLPLLDGLLVWEAFGNLLFTVAVGGGVVTHGRYVEQLDTVRVTPRVAFGATALCAVAMGASFALATSSPGSVVLSSQAFMPPVQYVLLWLCAFFCLINVPPLAALAHTWYTGATTCGFAPEDAPGGRQQTVGAATFLSATLVCCAVGGALWASAAVVVEFSDDVAHTHGAMKEAPLAAAEKCRVIWGASGWDEASRSMETIGGFDLSQPSAQQQMLWACEQLGGFGANSATPTAPTARPSNSPIHSDAEAPTCVVKELHDWVVARAASGGAPDPWPLAAATFASVLREFLAARPELREYVGFADDGADTSAVAYVWVDRVRAKFQSGLGDGALELLADPVLLTRYKDEWDAWWAGLPAEGRAASVAAGVPVSGADADSILSKGEHTCAKWTLLATESAYFGSVWRALTITPLASMGAIALFARSLVIAYAALYALVGMLVTLLGCMKVFGVPLGVTSALALSLVIGMSVDYIIHLAHAYKNSLFSDRYHKSRAALFARGQSIASAAITTAGAVLPLLFAQLLPLRQFGKVFVMVSIISFVFAVFFLAILMVVGPLRTRSGQYEPRPRPAAAAAGRDDGPYRQQQQQQQQFQQPPPPQQQQQQSPDREEWRDVSLDGRRDAEYSSGSGWSAADRGASAGGGDRGARPDDDDDDEEML